MKKEDALKIIVQCAKVYNSNLVDRNYLFVYQILPRKIECLDTLFQSRNFMHLTGVKDTSGRGSVWFFNACVASRLSVHDFDLARDGTTEQKLLVLPALMQIHQTVKMIGTYNASKVNLKTEKLGGSVSACMGFVRDHEWFVPNTVLKADARDLVEQHHKIIAIYSKPVHEPKYCQLRYLAKGITPETLIIPDSVSEKLSSLIIKDFGRSGI